MSNVLITKFPVTAPDGTEYRVEIYEGRDSLFGRYAEVSLYTRGKWRMFKNVYSKTLREIHGNYDPAEPDYVRMVSYVIETYAKCQRGKALVERMAKSIAARKQAAVERFNAWDGHIETEVSADETH